MLMFLKSSGKTPIEGVRIKYEKKFGLEERHFILCRYCGNRITTMDHIVAVDGQHTHIFTNQEGISYEIGCFSSAIGCAIYGKPTLEFTWFDDFSWSLTHCSSCLIHMGWYYKCREESFFGLILDRLM